MLYGAYHLYQKSMKPLNLYSKTVVKVGASESLPLRKTRVGRHFLAGAEIVERLTRDYPRPPFAFDSTTIDGRRVRVEEEIVLAKPFCALRHFKCEGRQEAPRVLIVAPMAGHYASLMRYTVREFLPDHDVYITDWENARDVPRSAGDFGVEDFVDYVMDFLRTIGPESHILSACQPCPLVLAAVSVLAMKDDPAQPKSMVLMAGPVDPRIQPSELLKNGDKLSPDLLEKLVIDRVPCAYEGHGRRVYAGFRQLSFFMFANLGVHIRKHWEFYRNVVENNSAAAEAHRLFYDNYMAVMDGTATFWKETITRVFLEHHLPRGVFQYQGRTVDPGAIRKTALLTVEGENDEFCPPGQTKAAHTVCAGLPKRMRGHYVQQGVGHYGVFSGSKFSENVAPRVKRFMAAAAAGKAVPAALRF